MATKVISGTAKTVLKELDFDVDGFGEQKYLTEAQSSAKQILMLLFLRPGDFPSMPNVGIDISRAVRYKNMDVLTGGKLKQDITEQIKTYCPDVGLQDLTIYSTQYKGEYVLILDFKLEAEKTISVALTTNSKSLINYKVEFTT